VTQKRADTYEEFFKGCNDNQRALVERMLGDAGVLGIPAEEVKKLVVEAVKIEVKEELGEKHREEKREDERRDARRDGERGEKPTNDLPGSVNRPSQGIPPAQPKK